MTNFSPNGGKLDSPTKGNLANCSDTIQFDYLCSFEIGGMNLILYFLLYFQIEEVRLL